MEKPDQTYESIRAVARHEDLMDRIEDKRFKDDCARLAEDNPELAEWLEANGGRLA